MAYVVLGGRCVIGVVFLLSAASKLRSRRAMRDFSDSVRQLGIVSAARVHAFAVTVVAMEAVIPALLVFRGTAGGAGVTDPMTALGLGLAAVLLIVFTMAILAMLRRGVRARCRCFGPSATPLSARHVVRNGVLTAVALASLAASFAAPDRPLHIGVAITVMFGGLVAGILVAVLDDLIELFVAPETLTKLALTTPRSALAADHQFYEEKS